MNTLCSDFSKQQQRVRKIQRHYKEIGPEGAWAAGRLEALLQRAERMAISGELVERMQVYQEMIEVKN